MAHVHHESKTALLDAALSVFRVKGYTAAHVEDICEAADVTKGSFFHHFESKEEIAIAAAEHWIKVTRFTRRIPQSGMHIFRCCSLPGNLR